MIKKDLARLARIGAAELMRRCANIIEGPPVVGPRATIHRLVSGGLFVGGVIRAGHRYVGLTREQLTELFGELNKGRFGELNRKEKAHE